MMVQGGLFWLCFGGAGVSGGASGGVVRWWLRFDGDVGSSASVDSNL